MNFVQESDSDSMGNSKSQGPKITENDVTLMGRHVANSEEERIRKQCTEQRNKVIAEAGRYTMAAQHADLVYQKCLKNGYEYSTPLRLSFVRPYLMSNVRHTIEAYENEYGKDY